MDSDCNLDFLKRLAKGISTQFGRNCDVVIHDLSSDHADYPIYLLKMVMLHTEIQVLVLPELFLMH